MAEPAPLLTVEDAAPTGRHDVLLYPRVVVVAPDAGTFSVELGFPDGTCAAATARYDLAHQRNAQGTFALVRLLDHDDVPAGTVVWRRA